MLLAQHLPPPPEGFQPPILWGVEEHVRGLFDADGATRRPARLERSRSRATRSRPGSTRRRRRLGPIILASEALEAEGRWAEVRASSLEQTAAANQATDGSLLLEPEYLRSVIELPG